MSDAWCVYRRNCDAGAQGIVDRFIQVRVLQIAGTVERSIPSVAMMTARRAVVGASASPDRSVKNTGCH